MMSSTDDDWTSVERNLRRTGVKWGRLAKILGRKGVNRRTVVRLYVAVVHAVLLFGSETWVLAPWLEKGIEGFCHRGVRRMAGMVPKRQWDETYVYPHIGSALAMVELEDIGVYIAHRQRTVVHYIATPPIMDLCLEEERKLVLQLSSKWW